MSNTDPVNQPSRSNQEYIMVNGVKRKNLAFIRGESRIKRKLDMNRKMNNGNESTNNIMDDFSNSTNSNAPLVFNSVKNVTDLCEDSLTTDSDLEVLSYKISQSENRYRPKDLRGMSQDEILSTIESWQDMLYDTLQKKTGRDEDPIITSNNTSGNAASSDLVATYSDGMQYPIETKFGEKTDSNSGVGRMENALGESTYSVPNREDILKKYAVDEKEEYIKNALQTSMKKYADEFNNHSHNVNGSIIYDMLKSSGKQGNSVNEWSDNYTILSFRVKNKKPVMEETTIDIKPDDKWDVTAELSEKNGSIRLNYRFTNRNNPQQTIKATFNNKNTLYVDKEGNTVNKKSYHGDFAEDQKAGKIIGVPSKYLMGTASFNVWFYDNSNVTMEGNNVK